ncbi:MAG: UvrD-helicase domain-containing protein [Anaerolineae bacterium]
MDLVAGLNPQQQEAVTALEGPVLVLAGPGSGKTRVLTHRVGYLIHDLNIAPWRVMAVTFTNKAAREMKERLGENLLSPAQLNSLTIGTFHAICARILRQEIELLGYHDRNFVIYDADDQQAVVRQALKEQNLDSEQWKPRPIHSIISRNKNELLTPEQFRPGTYREEIALRVYERYEAILRQNNALDFDDLLLKTHQLFSQFEEVLAKYQERYIHVLIDEFQDTNLAQYDLVKMLAGKYRNVFAVADEDQSIYSWRGADYRNVLRFRDDFPDHRLILLEQNYRSTEIILEAAKSVIRKNPHRVDKDLFTERGQGLKIRVIEAYNEHEEARFVVDEISRLDAANEIASTSDAAILYRTNAQSRVLEEAFIGRGMPYRLVRGTRFYERKEVKDALAYMRLIHNPDDSVSLERIINVPARGIGARTLAGLQVWAYELGLSSWGALQLLLDVEDGVEDPQTVEVPFAARARKALVNFARILSLLLAAREKLSLLELLDLALARSGYRDFLRDGTDEGESRWENLLELRTVAQDYSAMPGPEALALFLEDVALVSDIDGLNGQDVGPALLTLHMAKGLEFPVVFMVGMEEGIFPHSRSMQDPEQIEEERRLAYVGVTRARDRLYLLHAFRRRVFGNEEMGLPSRFLQDLPPDFVEGTSARLERSTERFGTHQVAQRVSTRWGDQPQEPALRRPAAARFAPGDRVQHAIFGEGTVIESRLTEGDEEVTIAFPEKGIKRLSASFAPLEKL